MEKFINEWNAKCEGFKSVGEYVDFNERLLKENKIEELEKLVRRETPNVLQTLHDYEKTDALCTIVDHAITYYINNSKNDKEKLKKLGDIYDFLWQKLYTFAKNYNRIKDKRLRIVAKATICLNSHWLGEDFDFGFAAKVLKKSGHLFRTSKTDDYDCLGYLVTGLHYTVGDNTFSYDKHGRMYRDYVKTATIQAFYVNSTTYKAIKSLSDEFKKRIPLLPPEYKPVMVWPNTKWAAKVYLSWGEISKVKRAIEELKAEAEAEKESRFQEKGIAQMVLFSAV